MINPAIYPVMTNCFHLTNINGIKNKSVCLKSALQKFILSFTLQELGYESIF